MTLQNPFTPGHGLYPPHFANRDREIQIFRKRLQATLAGTPRHLAVLGTSGLGKTSLLLKFRRIAVDHGCLTSLGSVNVVDNVESFLSGTVRTLALQVRASYGETAWNRLAKAMRLPVASGPTLEAALHRDFASMSDVQTSLRQYIRTIWEQTCERAPALLILIDNIGLLQRSLETMTVLRDTLADLGIEGVNVMAIIAGQSNHFSQFEAAQEGFDECFEPLELQPLTDEAIYDALITPIAGTPMRLDSEVADRIVDLAAGRPYYLQELAYHAFEMADPDHRVTPHTFELALEQTFYRVSTTIFEQQMTTLSESERRLLAVLINLHEPASDEDVIRAAAQAGLNEDAVPELLRDLGQKGYIDQLDEGFAQRRYSIPDPLFREYVRRYLDWIN